MNPARAPPRESEKNRWPGTPSPGPLPEPKSTGSNPGNCKTPCRNLPEGQPINGHSLAGAAKPPIRSISSFSFLTDDTFSNSPAPYHRGRFGVRLLSQKRFERNACSLLIDMLTRTKRRASVRGLPTSSPRYHGELFFSAGPAPKN